MTVLKLFGFAALCCAAAAILRAYKPELCAPFVLAAGTILFLSAMELLTDVFATLKEAFARFGVEMAYVGVALKIIVIAYLVQFASGMCRDAGESALSAKVEMAGRMLILSASAPVILGILDLVGAFALQAP